jgi:peroxiredoxin
MRFLTLFLLATVLFSCSKEDESAGPSAIIEGKISGLPAGDQKLMLKRIGVKGPESFDSCIIRDGTFSLKVAADSEYLYRIEIGNSFVPVFLEEGKHRLTADYSRMYESAVFSNSQLTDQMRKTESLRIAFESRAQALQQSYEMAVFQGRKSMADSAVLGFEILRLEYKSRIRKLIDSIGPGPVSYLATSMLSPEEDFSYLDSLALRFQQERPGKAYTRKLVFFMEGPRRLAIGRPAPDFQQPNPGGKMLSIASFRGKWLLLDFWASWCKPCRAESPFLVAMVEKYKAKGFQIFSVSLDGDREAWMKAIVQDGLNWPHASDLKGWQNSAAGLYGVQSIPASFLINPEGKIVAKNLRGKFLEEKLAEVLP